MHNIIVNSLQYKDVVLSKDWVDSAYVNNKKAHRFWEKEGYKVIALHFQKRYRDE